MAFKLKYRKSEFPFKKVNEALVEGAYPADADASTSTNVWSSITSGLADLGGALAGKQLRKKKAKEAEEALKEEKNKKLEETKDGQDVVDKKSATGFTGASNPNEFEREVIQIDSKG